MSAFTRASDTNVQAARAWRWELPDETARAALARELSQDGEALQVFDDVEAAALLAVAWAAGGEPPLPKHLDAAHRASPVWTADTVRVASWRARGDVSAGCLVVVRQPLKTPDPAAQRDWAATVLRALESDTPPEGLLSANFFASRDGKVVLNFAEWTSAEAHREALRRGSYGQHGSIGSSEPWRATREHPAITPEHEVRRYIPHRALAPS